MRFSGGGGGGGGGSGSWGSHHGELVTSNFSLVIHGINPFVMECNQMV